MMSRRVTRSMTKSKEYSLEADHPVAATQLIIDNEPNFKMEVNKTASKKPKLVTDKPKDSTPNKKNTSKSSTRKKGYGRRKTTDKANQALDILHEQTIHSLAVPDSQVATANGTYNVIIPGNSGNAEAVSNPRGIQFDPIHFLDYNCLLRRDLVIAFGDEVFIYSKID